MADDKVRQVYYEGQLYWVCTAEERKVLEAMAQMQDADIAPLAEHPWSTWHAVGVAELARRDKERG